MSTIVFIPGYHYHISYDSRKRHEKRLIFKIGTIHPHGLNEWFSFIWSLSLHSFCFCLAMADKSVDFSPFHSIFMLIDLSLIHFAHPPCLLIDFKNSKWLTVYLFLHIIMHLLLFLTWLAYFLSHDYLSYINSLYFLFIYFLFLSDEGPMLETLDYTIRIGSSPTFLYFDL